MIANLCDQAALQRRALAATLAVALACTASGCAERNSEDGAAPPRPEAGSAQAPEPQGTEAVALGTFSSRAQAEAAADETGRLPASGDLAAYIAATELFPGSARLDPGIRNPYAGNRDAIAAGERHFAAFNCGGCHAPLGGGGMGPPLSDDAWIYGSEPAQIYLSILHGRPEGMPAWGSMLPQRTMWELVAYVESLQGIDDYAAERGFQHAASQGPQGSRGSSQPGPSSGSGTTGTQADQ